MLVPLSASDDAHSHDHKYTSAHLYLRQPHALQIIQLVEGPPPPPRKITSVINDDYASSSAYSSSYSSSSSSSSACSSYCSSVDESDSPEESALELSTETYSATKRILAWRENFSAHFGATASESSLSSTLKRKISLEEGEDTKSKRSRSLASQGGASSIASLGAHSCPACDASFMTRQSLRQHGRDAKANEACSVAVEYAFE
ncbi:hypothetical protein LshimejAT787_1302000 [Lyophyllum shimeji]|uniref:Uncharacterized protein n=1 Tax=Lyophyllum shimeji TaxID=47721 RepID=A0A9P3UPY1_LYOSH|nr:hypothetical protein LshimejAT787_1302000 [Lyophyllum shimeji]